MHTKDQEKFACRAWKVFDNLQLFDLTKSSLNYITFAVFHFECLIFVPAQHVNSSPAMGDSTRKPRLDPCLSPTIFFYIGRPRRKCPRCSWRRCAVSLAYRLRCRSPIYRTCIFVALSCECTVCMRFASTFRRATLFLHQENLTTKYHESLIMPGDPVRSQVFVCQQSFGCRLPGDARPVRMKETNV